MIAERKYFKEKLASLDFEFDSLALDLYDFQRHYCSVYRDYLNLIDRNVSVNSIEEIAVLPISFFKTHQVSIFVHKGIRTFLSSGTGGERSKHEIYDLKYYLDNTTTIFSDFFGDLNQYSILALLPGYVDNPQSSLIAMINHFVSQSQYPNSGIYHKNYFEVARQITKNQNRQIPTILFGVSHALLDFAQYFRGDMKGIIVMDTGGMKGTRKELTKSEFQYLLDSYFPNAHFSSEYGMTELQSQAYIADQSFAFQCGKTMKVFPRDIYDPLSPGKLNANSALNIIDLANVDSCAFIATDDIARVQSNSKFEVLGRLDASDLRGCNLLWDS